MGVSAEDAWENMYATDDYAGWERKARVAAREAVAAMETFDTSRSDFWNDRRREAEVRMRQFAQDIVDTSERARRRDMNLTTAEAKAMMERDQAKADGADRRMLGVTDDALMREMERRGLLDFMPKPRVKTTMRYAGVCNDPSGTFGAAPAAHPDPGIGSALRNLHRQDRDCRWIDR